MPSKKKPTAKRTERSQAKKKTPAKRTKRPTVKQGARRTKRRNPGDIEQAAAMSEAFHGRPAHRVRTVDEQNDSPKVLAELGALRKFTVETPHGDLVELKFGKGVKLAANPKSHQLYIVGGDQSVDLEALDMGDEAEKDHAYLGEVARVLYHTKKGFHDFEPIDYDHEFGEEGGRRPRLNYDCINSRLYVTGGSYTIEPEGIRN